jgi:hypothetical protein
MGASNSLEFMCDFARVPLVMGFTELAIYYCGGFEPASRLEHVGDEHSEPMQDHKH